jgi:alpha,alpha-trehalose phosphorylase
MSDWLITESGLSPRLESVFALGNGYLGLRGTPEQGAPAHDPGAILNGFHETWPIVYPEDAYGMARTGQTTVPAPDGTIVRLFADDEPLDLSRATVTRTLDLRRGLLLGGIEWTTPRGVRLLVRTRRLVSLQRRHLAALEYEVVALDGPVSIALSSELVTHEPSEASDDPRASRGVAGLEPAGERACGSRSVREFSTRRSGLRLAVGMEHDGDGATTRDLQAGESLRLRKFVAYHWGADDDLSARVDRTLDRARAVGYDAIEREHVKLVEAFWERSDVELDGPEGLQRAVRFNLFQLMQATARAEGLGVPAKGVTGRGYEGHYFWDTEIYVVPFLAHTTPQWARQALEFRCDMLEAARERAREVGHAGALFPWRTINGAEASPRYASGTAQYHINADVAYALRHHRNVTGDESLLRRAGARVLVETARFWLELGFFSERRDGAFCIHSVTGPDEYTTVVDNNAYTNLMAAENLEAAADLVEWLAETDPAAYAELVAETQVTEFELAAWRRAAARMFVPRHAELGIVLQDDGFLERKRWDFESTPQDRYPLLLHYHPLEIFRHQVIKQADVVLATYLAGHRFSATETRRTFDYYDPLTTGDSTLSACIQSVVASQVGYAEEALRYFLDACSVDLADAHGNTADGIHIASCGGTWLALVAGFGGLRDFEGEPRFDPRLPAEWDRLRFRLAIRGRTLEVEMTHAGTLYSVLDGGDMAVVHRGARVELRAGTPRFVDGEASPCGLVSLRAIA